MSKIVKHVYQVVILECIVLSDIHQSPSLSLIWTPTQNQQFICCGPPPGLSHW